MKIGLLDIDGHNFPNYALTKISKYHKNKGDVVEWLNYLEKYDKVYISKVFTFSKDVDIIINSREIIKGGTGYNIKLELPKEIDDLNSDYSIYPEYDFAYGFLTRGCIRKCNFCVVPKKEGNIRPYRDIDDIIQNKKKVVLMDNNILASDFGLKQIEKIVEKKIKVDFNQGLDARIIADNIEIAELLSKVKWEKPLKMACDHNFMIPIIEKAVNNLRKFNIKPSHFSILFLVKNVKDGLLIARFLDSLNCDPFAQPYRDLYNNIPINKDLKDFARWVNHKAIFRSVSWEIYKKK